MHYFESHNNSEECSANKSCNHERHKMPKRTVKKFPGYVVIVRDVMVAGIFATGIWVLGEQFQKLGYYGWANTCNFFRV
jgi:hypothetical protein